MTLWTGVQCARKLESAGLSSGKLRSVRETDWSSPLLHRAGVIPVCSYAGILWFGMTVSKSSGYLSDFGGVVEDRDGDVLDTAIREFTEESNGVFGSVTVFDTLNCPVIHGPHTVDILYRVHGNPWSFSESFVNDPNSEVVQIVWLSLEQVIKMVSRHSLASRSAPKSVPFLPSPTKVTDDSALIPSIGKKYGYFMSRTVSETLFNNLELLDHRVLEPVVSSKPMVRRPYSHTHHRRVWRIFSGKAPQNIEITKSSWCTSKYFVFRSIHCMIGDSDRMMYYVKGKDNIRDLKKLMYKHKHKFVALDSDVTELSNYGFHTVSIESAIHDPSLKSEFVERIRQIRHARLTKETLSEEIRVMVEYDDTNYDMMKKAGIISKHNFNESKALYHHMLNTINKVLANDGHLCYSTLLLIMCGTMYQGETTSREICESILLNICQSGLIRCTLYECLGSCCNNEMFVDLEDVVV